MRIVMMSGQSSMLQNAAALATACHAADMGQRVLLVGTGPKGGMGKLVGETLKENPTELETNLAAMELGTLEEMKKRWEALCSNPRMGISGRLREIQADEIPSFPGMDEISALLVINQAALSDAFDLVVFGGTTIDSLLNGMTLRDMIRWIVRLVSGLDRGPGASRSSQDVALLAVAGSILNTVSSAGLLQDLRVALDRYCTWFDASIGTRVRLVMPAEELHLTGLRSIFYRFGLYGMQVDALIACGSATTSPRDIDIDAEVQAKFGQLLIPDVLPLTTTNVAGWAERGKNLYGKREAGLDLPLMASPESAPPPFPHTSEVRLHIPLLETSDLDIGVASEEVIVKVGPYRRHLMVAGMERGGNLRAKIEGETLRLWVD